MAEITSDDLSTAALSPQEAESDAGRVKARSADDILKLKNAAAAMNAAANNPIRGGWGGLRAARVVPPGSNGPSTLGTDV